MKFNVVVCGGTFDHFHKGHASFLNYALSLGGKLIVGLTSGNYVENAKRKTQNAKQIEPLAERKKKIEAFLKQEGVLDRAEIIPIDDVFGPTINKDFASDAIVVSEDTKKGAGIINQKRKELGLKELKIIVCSSVYAEDGKLISSERIRNGEIDREGKLYIKPEWLKKNLILPENLREELKKPFGEIVNDIDQHNNVACVITVGDATTKKFNTNSAGQNISVVDFKVARKEAFSSFKDLGFSKEEEVITANNPAGHIISDLFCKISKVFKSDFKNRIILKVIGEEDLAVLPLILAAPLGAIIYYGQPGQGLVRIEVSEKIKKIVYRLVGRFEMLK